jgi:IS5 family transposase
MGPKRQSPASSELFQQLLTELINLQHPLVKLAELIDWQVFETQWAGFFPSKTGRPATPPRLIAGLLYLQHTFALSDEALIWSWVENPYWQHFCGETHFQHEPPIDPSSLTRWRKRIGEAGVERLLSESIDAARRGKVVKEKSFDKVIVDTTVMEKAIAYPTDSQLLEKGRQHLVRLAVSLGIGLRQNYNWEAPRLAAQVARYAHAKQYRRMRTVLKTQRTILGRVWRDMQRKLSADQGDTEAVKTTLAKVQRLAHNSARTKTNSTAYMRLKSNASAKARFVNPMSSVLKSVSLPPTKKAWWWASRVCLVTRMMGIRYPRQSSRSPC